MTSRSIAVVLSLTVTVVACSSARGGTYYGDGGAPLFPGTGGEAGSATGTPPRDDPGGPELLSFGSSAKTLTEGGSIVVSAVFASRDGGSAVAGGVLLDELSGATVVSFHTTTGQTGLEATMTWQALNAAATIEFTKGATPARSLRASFFDDVGRKTERAFDVTLTCNGKGACAGACVDTDTSRDHCGMCGNACPLSQAGLRSHTFCLSGKCAQPLPACTQVPLDSNCNDLCAASGKTCSDTCGDGTMSGIGGSSAQCDGSWVTPACGETISGGRGFTFASCCCQ